MNKERLMKILQEPRITEKSTMLGDKYKQFVEFLFEVEVESVRTATIKGKQKRYQQAIGRRSDWKKAYVKLKPGFDIDFMSI